MGVRTSAAILLVGLVVGLVIGLYVPIPGVTPTATSATSVTGDQVAFTGTVQVQSALTVRFVHVGANATVNTVVPVGSNSKVEAVLVGGVSYNLTIKSSQGLQCASSLYIPSGVSAYAAGISCG
jgi:hypothetical protein